MTDSDQVTSDKTGADKPPRRVFGRKLGRPLRGGRLEAIDTLLPKLQIPADFMTDDGALDPATLYPAPYKELWFEIGFGNGEHLAGLMERAPDHAFIGAEPFINGMSAFLKDIAGKPHDNVRVHMDDALMVVDSLRPGCLDGIYVLNPDPWPKARHHKRRIISQTNLSRFARAMKPGATLVMATDVDELADWMREEALAHPAFTRTLDTRDTPADWIVTRYEQKGAQAGRQQTYLMFEKK